MHTVGNLFLADGKWYIDAQPHVMLRAKRLFAGSLNQERIVKVADTQENAVDLLWFMSRFPLEITKKEKKYLDQQAAAAQERTEQTRNLLAGHAGKVVELAKPLYKYQVQAVQFWLLNPRFLCGDDLGLGKTIQAIGGAANGLTPMACVVPNHLQRQWEAQFAAFAPSLLTHIAKKGQSYSLPASTQVLILNYDKLAGWAEYISTWARSVVYDEVQNLARRGSQKYAAALDVADKVTHIQGMSNTPIRNYGGEMFNVLSVLGCGDHLGSRDEFYREWCGRRPGTDSEPLLLSPEAFVKWLSENGLMLRRTAEQAGVKKHTPSVIPHEVDCDLAPLNEVASAAEELARIIVGEAESTNFDKMRAAGNLDWMLRQATGIAKAPYVAAFAQMHIENGEKVVIGLWHREVYTVLATRLQQFGVVQYSGTESPAQKEAAEKAFVEGDAKVLLLSLQSGEGLDGLQLASRICIVAEFPWTWSALHQLFGRLARPGQKHQVLAYALYTESGSDPIVMERIGLKKTQHDRLINPGAPIVTQVDKGHLKKLAQAWLERNKK